MAEREALEVNTPRASFRGSFSPASCVRPINLLRGPYARNRARFVRAVYMRPREGATNRPSFAAVHD